MIGISENYADELSAQFRTLNHFIKHAGEIGRAHEYYFRGVLSRYLPPSFKVGSGFVVSDKHVTHQQDIIIYDQQKYPTLYEVGDCIIADMDSVVGVIEVKTKLDKKGFSEAYKKSSDLYRAIGGRYLVGMYFWEGLNLNTALSVIWDHIRQKVESHYVHLSLPDVIYCRGKYLLMANYDGKRDSAPFYVLDINDSLSRTIQLESPIYVSEGQALLTFIVKLWNTGGFGGRPGWVKDWTRELDKFKRPINWPDDLQLIMST